MYVQRPPRAPQNPSPLNESRLTQLHDDILVLILREIRRTNIVVFSQTCRRIRGLCKPVLFEKINRQLRHPLYVSDVFCPHSLWPYVRRVAIFDMCPDREIGVESLKPVPDDIDESEPLTYAEDRFLCGVFDGESLEYALQNMPNLSSVQLHLRSDLVHGIPWRNLMMFLSLPKLEEFSIFGLLFAPTQLHSDVYNTDSLSSISTLRYEVLPFRCGIYPIKFSTPQELYSFRSEEAALSLVLEKLHQSIEVLALPIEPAPILAMSQWTWPRIQEIYFRGERTAKTHGQLARLFAAMPQLRTVVLELTIPELEDHTEPHPASLWPVGGLGTLPCPELECLAMTHPNAEDELYTHLSPSLHTLSLCCCPHKSDSMWIYCTKSHVRTYRYPILDSSMMLRLLSRCQTPRLTHLEIEYNGGTHELSLLHHLPAAFPRLSFLQIYRYRSHDNEEVPVNAIAHSLRDLGHLCTLRAYLDFRDTPTPVIFGARAPTLQYPQEAVDNFMRTLQGAATVLARGLGSSVTCVQLWRPSGHSMHEWVSFGIRRSTRDGEDVVEAHQDGVFVDPVTLSRSISCS
ncbi:hypothetical protein V8D89_002289 [Ganoderma adspersum]